MNVSATRAAALGLGCVFVAVALFFARPVATPGPALRDFEAYWSAGAAWNARQDPYARAVWSAQKRVPGVDGSRDEVLPFVGPPATLPLWSLFARLPYAAAASVWWTALALALLALLLLLARVCGGRTTPHAVFGLLVLALGFGPMTSDLALGQIALLALLGATGCVVFASQAVVASLGAFVAYAQPNVAAGLLSQLGRNRATLALALGAIAAYLAGVAGMGWAWPVEYARILLAHADAERFTAIQLSPAAIAYGFGFPAALATWLGYAVAIAAVAAAVALARRTSDRFVRFAAISALVPLVAGFFHEHDLVVAFPAAASCAFRARGSARILAALGTLLVAIDWLGLAQRPSGIAQSALLAAAALAAFAFLGEEADLRDTFVAGLCAAPVFAFAALLGTGHPAPVWPDTLGSFHASAGDTVAGVWHAEQRVAGLLAVNPAWAFLRMLSLLGCALLATAVARTSSLARW
jgi:hypothetical protein